MTTTHLPCTRDLFQPPDNLSSVTSACAADMDMLATIGLDFLKPADAAVLVTIRMNGRLNPEVPRTEAEALAETTCAGCRKQTLPVLHRHGVL
ncbi:MAG: hypothetical protein R3C44_03205 [Chloroflexota bacterium]